MTAAIVSLACRYPDAATPEALWQNALEGRRSFRSIPPERIDLARYAAAVVGEADSITEIKAGLLTDWQFDCDRFRVPQAAFAAADLSHWLALEVAADAIAGAGGLDALDRERTAVVVANTLTGEFSRAALLRLRAPFLDDVLAEAIGEASLDDDQSRDLRRRFSTILRGRFPDPTEESLAGALANTIAGRIANHFDLRGGAYSVDGACASSLVAVADAANLLVLGQVDAVLVGAVDLSLDPFELVGFSRNGALARDEMRVFDQRSSGFWPGEGAAFLLLMREDEARRRGCPIRTVLRGWGISSDGAGGLTRPSVEGQLSALRRAHEMAGTDPGDVGYVEAHGTGTAVGDGIEITALARWRNGAATPLPIGSVKANIGHTKAAAGLAGLIKTVGALSNGYVPPHVGCSIPHKVFREVDGVIRPALEGEAWPTQSPRLAGVSGFGFGGINAHVVLEWNGGPRPTLVAHPPHRVQDAELFVFSAPAGDALVAQMVDLRGRLAALSLAEFTDVAATCARSAGPGPCRVAVVAREPRELERKLETAIAAVEAGSELIDAADGIHVARRHSRPRIGLLFPGQAAPSRPDGGLWTRRFDLARAAVASIPQAGEDAVRTEIAQPAIAAASIVAWRVLQGFGLDASMAVGHSLGELTALAWAEAIEDGELLRLAAARGAVIAAHARSGGAMLRIAAQHCKVAALIEGLDVAVACRNGPGETVVSGPSAAISIAAERARHAGLETTLLAVSHAFHSAMIEPACAPFTAALAGFAIGTAQRPLVSTVTGALLGAEDDLRDLLARQLVAPVQFDAALRRLADACDLLIEAGPGGGLTRLARGSGTLAISTDAFADSLFPLLSTLGATYVLGAAPRLDALFEDRPTRAVNRTAPRFLTNPCGRRAGVNAASAPIINLGSKHPDREPTDGLAAATDELALVQTVIAEETGFAADKIRPDDRFLDDLHLNSLAVSRIAAKAARLLSCSAPVLPSELVKGTPRILAAALAERRQLGPEQGAEPDRIQGARPWVRTYAVHWVRQDRPGTNRVSSWRVLTIRHAQDDRTMIEAIDAHHGRPDGLLIWLGAAFDESATHELFAACRTAWAANGISRLAICHAGAPVSAFAHSLAIEGRFESVAVIDRSGTDGAIEFILGELDAATTGFAETRVDAAGLRWVPEFVPATPPCRRDAAIGRDDVLLVIGGAKGIGAECALRTASRFGAALILVGRARADDPAVTATLARAAALNIRCRYAAADVCDVTGLSAAVAIAAADLGAVTALLHAAGLNDPAPFEKISDADLHRIMAPKTIGLRAAIAAAGPRLRRIITFGSILGRMGLKGEAHYGIANAWQSVIAEAFERSNCHVLSLEWSVWNGVGMGHRLGAVERLARLGVDALPVEAALDMFEALVRDGAVGTFMITSRFGPPPHISCGATQLPLLRFVDNVLLHYPGVELVVETALSRGRDLYATDHSIDGIMIFPAVLALEAMAQVACALAGRASAALIEKIAFPQAIAIPDDGATKVRIMALADGNGRVEVAIRASEDSFAVDRMSAVFVFDSAGPANTLGAFTVEPTVGFDAQPLYGPLFFQGDRFRCIRRFSHLTARRVAALLSRRGNAACFSQFESQQLVLGDPNVRDALLHALQAAAPHRRVIPVSVGRIRFHPGKQPVRMEAVERDATDERFQFDIIARDDSGAIVEHWQDVCFRAISRIDNLDEVLAAAPALIPAYVERVARAALEDASIEVALICDRRMPRDQRRSGALTALGLGGRVFSRSDGRPILTGCDPQESVSIAHRDAATLAVRASGNIGCDIECIADWTEAHALSPLSPSMAAFAAELASDVEPLAIAAARLWSLSEATIKHAQPSERHWKARRSSDNRVVLFETASGRTATIHVPGPDGGLVIAIARRTADPLIAGVNVTSSCERIA
jgi:enediyne polyketide synthase